MSALYTEPFWDSGVGVRIYYDAGKTSGIWASCMGTVAALLSVWCRLLLEEEVNEREGVLSYVQIFGEV